MKRWLLLFLLLITFFRLKKIEDDKKEGISNEELFELLTAYTEAVEAEPQRWMYSNKSSDFKDCSGMFIRMCEELQDVLPADYDFPSRSERGTRDLARWYAEHGDLQLVRQPQVSSAAIKVGSIMFFGRANKGRPGRFDVTNLTAAYPKGLLAHMGVVVAVDRAEDGQLLSYTLFHGRSSGKPAARSIIRRSQNPDFGNWGQPWLAYASLLHRP